jgi:hypothetical protein
MRKIIPAPLLSVCAEISASRETHATLESLFTYAGAPGDPPSGSKPAKALEWLRRTNKDESIDPLAVLGKLIENYMEQQLDQGSTWDQGPIKDRERIQKNLSLCGFQYIKGGHIVSTLGAPSRTLEQFIQDRDIPSVSGEFDRSLSRVDSDPREAVSAASNILESICKVYIEDKGIEKPSKQDLNSVWAIVRKDLGFDPSLVEDQDLQKILSGMISVVHGIGSLRTHASSAHGVGRKSYKIEPKHARLAIHAAHTIALFVLESWERKKNLANDG